MSRRKSSEEISQQILEAANQRFQQYGYNKTTMAEIAMDCDMSAANLYRHFKNKMDIVAQLARQCMGEVREKLLTIIMDDHRSASERLMEFAMCQLHHHYNEYMERPKLNELVDIVCQQHHHLVEEKIDSEQEMLTRLIAQGVDQGEFHSDDPHLDAEAVHAALTMISTPFFIPIFPIEVLEHKARHLVRLLLTGLQKPNLKS